MKIVIVGTAYPWRGGIAHYLALLYRHLSERHDVEIVTFSRQYPKILFPGKTQEEQGGSDAAVPSEQLIDSVNPWTWHTAAQAIAAKKPDLLVFKYWLPFFGPSFGYIARVVKRRTNARVLFICDNIIPHERRPGDIAFTRYAFKSVDFFIAQSKAVERELIAFQPQAVYRYVPHPVYEIFGKPISQTIARKKLKLTEEKVILFFGYIRKYKGLDLLLRAMPEILRKTSVQLIVAGEFYDDEEKYRTLIRQLGLEKNVMVCSDYIPNEEVSVYFSASDVVVLPYVSATQSGIAQIAYQFDKPVIATDVGGLSEVVIEGKTGFVVPPNDERALAESVVRFYKERKAKQFQTGVRKEKRRYTWEALMHAIEELMKGKR